MVTIMFLWSNELQNIFDTLHHPSIILSESMTLMFANKPLRKMQKARIVGKQLSDLEGILLNSHNIEVLASAMDRREAVSFMDYPSDLNIVNHWFCFPYSDHYLVCLIINITKDYKEKKEFGSQKNLLDRLFSLLPTGCLIFNEKAQIIKVNPVAEEFLFGKMGYNGEPLSCNTIFCGEEEICSTCPVLTSIQDNKPSYREFKEYGQRKPFSISTFPLSDGYGVGFIHLEKEGAPPLIKEKKEDKQNAILEKDKTVPQLYEKETLLVGVSARGLTQLIEELPRDLKKLWYRKISDFMNQIVKQLNLNGYHIAGDNIFLYSHTQLELDEIYVKLILASYIIGCLLNPIYWKAEELTITMEDYTVNIDLNEIKPLLAHRITTSLSLIFTRAVIWKGLSYFQTYEGQTKNMIGGIPLSSIEYLLHLSYNGSIMINQTLYDRLMSTQKLDFYKELLSSNTYYHKSEKVDFFSTFYYYNSSEMKVQSSIIFPIDPYFPQKVYTIIKRLPTSGKSSEEQSLICFNNLLTAQFCPPALSLIESQLTNKGADLFSFSAIQLTENNEIVIQKDNPIGLKNKIMELYSIQQSLIKNHAFSTEPLLHPYYEALSLFYNEWQIAWQKYIA